MLYQSPLHIIPKTIEFDGSAKQLKRLRKELLLRFDLSGHTTIDIKGKVFDKQSVLQAFNALTQAPAFHLKIYQHRSLLNFLEKQDLAFFRNSADWAILADIEFQNQLQPYFTAAYSKKLKAILAQKVTQPEKELSTLLNKDFHLPESYEAAAYMASMSYLRQWIQEITAKYRDYLENKYINKLTIELKPYFASSHLSAFSNLPNHFEKLKHQYANLAIDLINAYVSHYPRYSQMGYHTAHLAKNIANVIYQLTGNYEEGYKSLKRHADSLEAPAQIQKRHSQVFKIVAGIFIAVGLFFSIFIFSTAQANKAKAAKVVGRWSTKIKLFKGKEKILRVLELKADGTGQTQIIILDSSYPFCLLSANFEWEIHGNSIQYDYERIGSKSQTISIYQNPFLSFCDNVPAKYEKIHKNLAIIFSKEKIEERENQSFLTSVNKSMNSDYLFNIISTQSGMDEQLFYYERMKENKEETEEVSEFQSEGEG